MKFIRIISVLVAVLVLASACSSQKKPAASGSYSLATGGTTGTYYSFGTTIAAVWDKYLPGTTTTVEATGASKENLRLISSGGADYAIVQNDILWYAQNGRELFAGEKLSGIASVCSLYREYVQLVVPANSTIMSLADLAGKRVSVGVSGSGTEANSRQLLAAAGLSYDDITVKYQGFSDSVSGLKGGTVDAAFVTAGAPNAAVEQLAGQIQLRLIPIDTAVMQALTKEYPFYTIASVPASAYGLEEDVPTLAISAVLVCMDSLSDDEVYAAAAAIYDHLPELGAAHAKGLEMSLDTALTGISGPLHGGAGRYFTEKGVK